MYDKVKDSGKRESWDTGSRRDLQVGKPRYDLIPAYPLLRLAQHFANGSEKYGDHNWTKGQPISRYVSSLMRHIEYWRLGMEDEDHLSAAIWNLMCIIDHIYRIEQGTLDPALDDRDEWPQYSPGNLIIQLAENIKKAQERMAAKEEVNPEDLPFHDEKVLVLGKFDTSIDFIYDTLFDLGAKEIISGGSEGDVSDVTTIVIGYNPNQIHMTMALYNGARFTYNEKEILALFESYGIVEECKLPDDPAYYDDSGEDSDEDPDEGYKPV